MDVPLPTQRRARAGSRSLRLPLLLVCVALVFSGEQSLAQRAPAPPPAQPAQSPAPLGDAASELKQGTALTRTGQFEEAIPHLLAAQRAGADRYATTVNLAICSLGLRRYPDVINLLTSLQSAGYNTAPVDNLLTQAYIGAKQTALALQSFADAAALTPEDEKLYAFIADACTDHQAYALGLHVTELGLHHLPNSARLHYERALFLAQLDRLNEARPEFNQAAQLAPGGYIAYLAQVQIDLYDDRFPAAIALLHEAINAGHRDYQMLSLLGTVLMDAGALPGSPEFLEARDALEASVLNRPDYSATQIALGKLYLMEDRYQAAADHLEIALRLEPDNPAVYTNLAHAYRRLGKREKATRMQAALAQLLARKNSSPIP